MPRQPQKPKRRVWRNGEGLSKAQAEARSARCITGKGAFLTEQEAEDFMREVQANPHRPDEVPIRAYACGFCECWHLTKQRLMRGR